MRVELHAYVLEQCTYYDHYCTPAHLMALVPKNGI